MNTKNIALAILYQAQQPPARNGIIKPMKPTGYADSGADIAYALLQQNIPIITPKENPGLQQDTDWVFPDTTEGIQLALDKGANTLWLNTILYNGHPVEQFFHKGIYFVGQLPYITDRFDDKWITNRLLHEAKLPIPRAVMVQKDSSFVVQLPFDFPVVVKPILGRGSEGVTVVKNDAALKDVLTKAFRQNKYGDTLYVEEFLPGEELTVAVMPPGKYIIAGEEIVHNEYWYLPPVKRFNHVDGIAPYNGTVAVVDNSCVLDDAVAHSPAISKLCHQCVIAAKLVEARAPIRVDCRSDFMGSFYLFDLNMKPNMTGASRPHRGDQDSLIMLAARKAGWTYADLLLNILHQRWQA
ncbi:MAG: ATP-grasp domain-containing protein [Filimonas sp.]|nr:ATP-grasp domain-containing protein [Filimonas sp.]